MYPNYGSTGGGLLRLHSTYRHDFKIYSSDEGRVQVAAAAFTKGLLDLEGSSLTPILVSLVAKDATMLDAFGKVGCMLCGQSMCTPSSWEPLNFRNWCPDPPGCPSCCAQDVPGHHAVNLCYAKPRPGTLRQLAQSPHHSLSHNLTHTLTVILTCTHAGRV